EVNLNLGCPSGTVTAKGKGSGALRDTDSLDRFLNDIFAASPIPVSVKTRIGFTSADEFPVLLDIFNRYPIKELTIHPRTRADFYKGPVNKDCFSYAVANSKNPLCFNGNLYSISDIAALQAQHPQLTAVMMGRGLIGDPGMLTPGGTDRKTLQKFHDALFEAYTGAFGSGRNAISRMKENWHYLIGRFDGGDRLFKKLRKTTDVQEFCDISREIFETVPFRDYLEPNW
ncbi:MAG: tRNA-dihydrouridine synthase, partial [Oscillospiraceae bacterium]|nr:tRNA-dihydrouridine synthase [Oscillospiraceae bacterium]